MLMLGNIIQALVSNPSGSLQNGRKLQINIANHQYVIRVGDFLSVLIAGIISYRVWEITTAAELGTALTPLNVGLVLATSGLWVFLGVANDFYDPEVFTERLKLVRRLTTIGIQMMLVYLLVFFVAPANSVPRLPFLYHSIAAFGLVAIWRACTLAVSGHAAEARRAIVVGNDDSIKQLGEYLRGQGRDKVYRIVGVVTDDAEGSALYGFPVLGGLNELNTMVKRYDVRELVLTQDYTHSESASRIVVSQYESGVQFVTVPHLYERLSGRIPVDFIGQNWSSILPTDVNSEFNGWHFLFLKRGMDIVLSLIGLAFFALILPLLAVVIKLDSPGTIFYRQKRTGLYGKTFTLTKLRTMVKDAEAKTGATFAQVNDARITRVGAFLRKSRLDELPQLINVLRGEMSIIGPRPERPEIVERLAEQIPYFCTRHVMRPGLTGWAQVRYGYGSSLDDSRTKLEYDLYYIRNASIGLDITILMRTVYKVLTLGGR